MSKEDLISFISYKTASVDMKYLQAIRYLKRICKSKIKDPEVLKFYAHEVLLQLGESES